MKLQEILNEKANAEAELEHKYERWEYLNNLAEEIENSKIRVIHLDSSYFFNINLYLINYIKTIYNMVNYIFIYRF